MKYGLSAFFSAAILFLLLGSKLHAFQPAWAAHLIVLSVVFIGLLLALSQRKYSNIKRPIFLPTFSTFILFILIFQILSIPNVVEQAKTIAGDKPYCVQVTDNNEYIPADTILALSPLTMKANSWNGMANNFHALMVVESSAGKKMYNWSYRQKTFTELPRPEYWHFVYCEPKKDYLNSLPLIFPGNPSDTMHVTYGETKYAIPTAYYPKASSYNKSVTFTAIAPDFKPIAVKKQQLSLWDRINSDVMIIFKENMKSFVSHQGEYNKFDYARNNEGELTVKIECTDSMCNHVFLDKGKTYLFSYPAEYFDQRKELQQKIIELAESFELNAKQP